MKCFICKYYQRFGYGAYCEYHYVTFANTASEALGMCLEQEGNSVAKYWEIDELECVAGATLVYSKD